MSRWVSKLGVVFGSLALLLAVAAVGGVIYQLKMAKLKAAASAPKPPEMPEAVTLVDVESTEYRPSVTSIGTIKAPRWITLRNEVPGRIVKLSLSDGKIVGEGEVLIELDHSVEDAQLKSAQARQRIARSVYDRTVKAAQVNASSGTELDQADSELAQSTAEVERLQAIIDKKTLRAPFRARAGLMEMYLGQYLTDGTAITTLQGIDDYVHVDFMMPEAVADSVEIGQTVHMLYGTGPLPAEVIAVEAIADRTTRNLMARAKLNNPPPNLQPNDSVKVQVEYSQPVTVLTVPASALRRSPSGSYVFIAVKDEEGKLRAKQHSVVSGGALGNRVTILNGLEPTAKVIADGSFKLRDGLMVAEPAASSATATDANASASATK